jgi:hypothetical protein
MFGSFVGFTLLINFILPIVVIYAIYRLVTRDTATARRAATRDLVVGILALITGYVGIISLYRLPEVFLSESESAMFATRMVAAVACLVAGAFLRELTGKLLMVVGLLLVIISSPFIFDNLGSKAAYVFVLLSFLTLIGVTVYLHNQREKKVQTNG